MYAFTKSDLRKKSGIELASLFHQASLHSGKPDPEGHMARKLVAMIRIEQARREPYP